MFRLSVNYAQVLGPLIISIEIKREYDFNALCFQEKS